MERNIALRWSANLLEDSLVYKHPAPTELVRGFELPSLPVNRQKTQTAETPSAQRSQRV
jgi:hypothetical protein